MKRTFFVCFFLVSFLSSYKVNDCLFLIFKNDTSEDFKQLRVYTSDGFFFFFDLKKGESTEVIEVTNSYNFTYAEAITSNDTLVTPGYCRTGEKVYTEGKMLMTFKTGSKNINGKRDLLINTEIKSTVDSASMN